MSITDQIIALLKRVEDLDYGIVEVDFNKVDFKMWGSSQGNHYFSGAEEERNARIMVDRLFGVEYEREKRGSFIDFSGGIGELAVTVCYSPD